jgi:hypothetical protein
VRGSRRLRESVEVGETRGDKTKAVRHDRRVDNDEGARRRREALRSLRGEHSEGGSQERLRHETRPRSLGGAEAAEGLRKPESGSEAEVNGPPHYGAHLGDTVEGARQPWEVISQPTGWQGQEDAQRRCKGYAAREHEPEFSDFGDRQLRANFGQCKDPKRAVDVQKIAVAGANKAS